MNESTLFKLNYGVYVIASEKQGKYNGCIVNTVFQVTAEPIQITISVHKENLTHDYIMDKKRFTASILSQNADMKLIGNFGFKSGKDIDKFANIKHEFSPSGLPYVAESTVGWTEVEVTKTVDIGTHTLFIGEVKEAEMLSMDTPMTYAYYHDIKRGKTPEKAASYINTSKNEEKNSDNEVYVCNVCGYEYNPEDGDPDSGIAPGTKFEDIPDDWVCPICGVTKENFSKK